MKHPGIRRQTDIAVAAGIVLIVLVLFWRKYTDVGEAPATDRPAPISDQVQDVSNLEPGPRSETVAQPSSMEAFVPPISRSDERVTKKPFGIHITRATSPVQPERFSGYHTGVDFETFPEEQENDVEVSAACSGKLLMKRSASGYGGVIAQSCVSDGEPITVIYGHMRLSSVQAKAGESIQAGDFLANLGAGYSVETDGERKHLHLGIHKGTLIDLRGYVSSKGQLSGWINPYALIISEN